jgi:hypothetical protein
VVEVAPPYDHAEVTAFLANRVVLEALSGIAWRRQRTDGDGTAATGAGRAAGAAGPAGAAALVRAPEWPLLSGRGPRTPADGGPDADPG